MVPGREIVQSLWIGDRLSVMEQLSIRSFLDHGYAYHLYTYQEVKNVPARTVILPGEQILPADQIFRYVKGYGEGSVAAFANFFRYKLLLERGGWWTDLDSVCMQPLDFEDEHVAGRERTPDGTFRLANGLIRAPCGSRLLEYCWDACQKVDRADIVWGQIGPRLLTEAFHKVGVPVRVVEPDDFYPVNYWDVWQLIDARQAVPSCYAIHLWNSRWRHERLDPDAVYSSTSIYEQLKRRFGVESPPGARRGPPWRSRINLWWWRYCSGRAKTAPAV